MNNFVSYPEYLSIQTTSFCNAHCIFCPNDEVSPRLSPRVMDETLFRKIIDDCGGHRTIKRIILYLNNEPLTDINIVQRINYAKEKVPWACVHILTNGSLLDDKTQDALINSRLDWIGISMHGIRKETIRDAMGLDSEIVLPRVLSFIQKAKEKKKIEDFVMLTFLRHQYLSDKEKEEIFDFWKKQGITRISFFEGPVSRGGNVKCLPQARHAKVFGCKSIWANEMMHIVENGDVILCCMDWKREVVLGNLNTQSIYEVWNSPRYAEARGKRDGIAESEENFICKRCEESASEDSVPKVILVNVPPWQTKMPPLGVACLSSFLKSKGIVSKVIDLNVKLFNKADPGRKELWEIDTINNFTPLELGDKLCSGFRDDLNSFIDEMARAKTKIIGLSVTIASLNVAIHIAHWIKKADPSKIVVMGGPGVYWNTERVDPEKIVDLFVVGEGELPLLEVIRRFEENKSLENLVGIPGTIVCLDKQYHSFSPPNYLKDIDQLPMIDFSDFDLSQYNPSSEYRPLPLISSRGCINRCSFCVDHKLGGPYRFRSPEKVFADLNYYLQKFDIHQFEFNDLLCNGNLKQLEAICDLIIENKIAIQWLSYAAIRKGMVPELLGKLKRSGCVRLCYGMESASDKVLKKMNKSFDSTVAEQVIRDTHRAGISTAINIIVGHPGESGREFKETCDFLVRNRDFIDEITNVSTCFLMHETDLTKNMDKFGIYFKPPIKERFLSFFKKAPVEHNYRKFYVKPDNSPWQRARRLRKILGLISKLRIPYQVINRVKEDDVRLGRVFHGRKNNETMIIVSSGPLRVNLDPGAKIMNIYCHEHKLTANVGISASFYIKGKWHDSSLCDWSAWRKAGNLLSLRVDFEDIPVFQNWQIEVDKKFIVWSVKTHFTEEVIAGQQKFGLVFNEAYDGYSADGESFELPAIEDSWRDVGFLKAGQLSLASSLGLPKVEMQQEGRKDKKSFIEIQNLPCLYRGRMVNFCLLDLPSGRNDEGVHSVFRKDSIHTSRIVLRFEA